LGGVSDSGGVGEKIEISI